MPTLLQINTVINSGSTGRIAEGIGCIAMDNGWKSYIAYGRNDQPSKSHKIKIGNKFDIYWHVLMTRLFDKHAFSSKNATKKLIQEIEEIAPDIIHLHNLHGYYLNLEILLNYIQRKKIPVLLTLHDCWLFTGHCAHFDFIRCDKWKTQCYACPAKKDYPSSLILDRSKKNYKLKKNLLSNLPKAYLVPVSNWLSDLLAESFLSEIPKKVIYNGVDTNVFKPNLEHTSELRKKHELYNKFVILGVAAVWHKQKGLFDFIELSEKIDNNTTQIIMIGLTEEQVEKLPSNIIGISRTDNIDMLAAYYNIADLFVNPTWEDNFPTTNIEALACGTPIVTYKTGGSIEAVAEGVGYIVGQGDIDALISVIEEVRVKGKNTYFESCRDHVVENFDMHKQFTKYFDIYRQLQNK